MAVNELFIEMMERLYTLNNGKKFYYTDVEKAMVQNFIKNRYGDWLEGVDVETLSIQLMEDYNYNLDY